MQFGRIGWLADVVCSRVIINDGQINGFFLFDFHFLFLLLFFFFFLLLFSSSVLVSVIIITTLLAKG